MQDEITGIILKNLSLGKFFMGFIFLLSKVGETKKKLCMFWIEIVKNMKNYLSIFFCMFLMH